MLGIGHEPPAVAVHEGIEFLEDRLSDQHLAAQRKRFFERVAAVDLNHRA